MLARVLPYAKNLAQEIVRPGDTVVDATCGNGHDTKFLSELTGPDGHVLSFDIQSEAIENARELCSPAVNIEFILDSHANVDDYLSGRPVKAGMFNLGYLPKGDKTITTEYRSTIRAIEKLFRSMVPGGRIIIVVYHGHPEGKLEKEALTSALAEWPQKESQILEYRFINQKNDAPYILCIEKNSKK
ncbi:MAG TPA: class I SAM-dependent methyltransferase [Candidatus Salinicoccus stercoripullorum]|uniref:Class I SAM-dependent methyltransferase n=1 Tax=Candidatus Salinicoccus stercoripullorum TaxID=2838756 RepID=A0A9D1QGY3_9STAP|nr:class I SAM-dependent methyltransferase [Candidatus Salinicoccus stercoripullorum]